MSQDAPFAALPMYDFPHLRDAHAALWTAIAGRLRAQGVAAPAELNWKPPPESGWTDPRLLVGQTCGYPLIKRLGGAVQVLATPRYAAPGCEGAFHRSAIVVAADSPWRRLEDLRGSRCALNAPDSNSGMNLLRDTVADVAGGRPFFAEVIETGAHRLSLAAVTSGRADVAAIDGVTFELLRGRDGAGSRALRVLGWTRSSPGLPWITSAATDAATTAVLRQALLEAGSDPATAEARRVLLIDGFEVLPAKAYGRVAELEQDAVRKGYPALV